MCWIHALLVSRETCTELVSLVSSFVDGRLSSAGDCQLKSAFIVGSLAVQGASVIVKIHVAFAAQILISTLTACIYMLNY